MATTVPAWASKIVRDVALAYEIPTPIVTWTTMRRRNQFGMPYESSAGKTCRTLPARIKITAGSDLQDQKHVLLHELAHAIAPKAKHGPEFHDWLFVLARRYGIPDKYVIHREGGYHKGTFAAARRAGCRISKAEAFELDLIRRSGYGSRQARWDAWQLLVKLRAENGGRSKLLRLDTNPPPPGKVVKRKPQGATGRPATKVIVDEGCAGLSELLRL